MNAGSKAVFKLVAKMAKPANIFPLAVIDNQLQYSHTDHGYLLPRCVCQKERLPHQRKV